MVQKGLLSKQNLLQSPYQLCKAAQINGIKGKLLFMHPDITKGESHEMTKMLSRFTIC